MGNSTIQGEMNACKGRFPGVIKIEGRAMECIDGADVLKGHIVGEIGQSKAESCLS
jgi:hypothetical protein